MTPESNRQVSSIVRDELNTLWQKRSGQRGIDPQGLIRAVSFLAAGRRYRADGRRRRVVLLCPKTPLPGVRYRCRQRERAARWMLSCVNSTIWYVHSCPGHSDGRPRSTQGLHRSCRRLDLEVPESEQLTLIRSNGAVLFPGEDVPFPGRRLLLSPGRARTDEGVLRASATSFESWSEVERADLECRDGLMPLFGDQTGRYRRCPGSSVPRHGSSGSRSVLLQGQWSWSSGTGRRVTGSRTWCRVEAVSSMSCVRRRTASSTCRPCGRA